MGAALVDRVDSAVGLIRGVHDSDLGPGAAVVGFPPSPQASGSRARVIAATLRCVARFGLSKTTVDDIAREAGLSRATLYRSFPGGRDEVLGATLEHEVRAFAARLAVRLEAAADLEDLLVTVLTASAEEIVRHEALAVLARHEPEVVLPHLSFSGFDRVLEAAGSFLGPYLAPELGETQARRVAEWLVRLVVSHVACPPGAARAAMGPCLDGGAVYGGGTTLSLHPEPIGLDRARRLVRQFVLPGIDVLVAAAPAAPAAATGATATGTPAAPAAPARQPRLLSETP